MAENKLPQDVLDAKNIVIRQRYVNFTKKLKITKPLAQSQTMNRLTTAKETYPEGSLTRSKDIPNMSEVFEFLEVEY